MKRVRFKEKGRSGQVLGLGTVTNEWKEVSDKDMKYFEEVNTSYGPPNAKGERPVVRKKTLANYGIEVESVTEKKKEDEN